jgi:drug/metabolite transporter (DMT)-like permease
LSPVELNFLRFSVASLTFLPLVWLYRGSLRLTRDRIGRLLMLCALGFVLNKGFDLTGLNWTSASDNALLIASEGLFTAIFGWLLLHERIRLFAILGLCLSFAGVYLVIERGFVLPRMGSGTRILGDLFIVGALIFEALYTVLGKAELERYPGGLITGFCVITSLVVWLPAAGINVAASGLPHMSLRTWAGVLYLAIAGTTLAYVGWISALRYVNAVSAAPTLFLQPLLGTTLAVLLLGERVTWPTVVGGVLIITGIWVVSRDPTEAKPIVRSVEVVR